MAERQEQFAHHKRLQQAEALCPLQQHSDRGRLPAGSPTRGAFAHRLQPVADCLQRDVGIRSLVSCDNGGQAVVSRATSGTGEHVGRKK